jgi:hypothetical protein
MCFCVAVGCCLYADNNASEVVFVTHVAYTRRNRTICDGRKVPVKVFRILPASL